MTRRAPATGIDLRAQRDVRAKGRAGATAHLVVAVSLFIVLAGIWACLWVPPSRGF
ncbi:MAG: hypothetical protein PVI07_02695 [Anaerolineae bacterium]|jgi:type II secretory pathway component PulM